jgi:hypothetical protein
MGRRAVRPVSWAASIGTCHNLGVAGVLEVASDPAFASVVGCGAAVERGAEDEKRGGGELQSHSNERRLAHFDPPAR